MWFPEHFIPKLDGDIFKQNVGCGPSGASSAERAGFLPGLCQNLSPHAAPYGAALLGWDDVPCDGDVGLSHSHCLLRVKPGPAESASQ